MRIKLGVRIALTVVLSILFIEAVIGFFTIRQERRNLSQKEIALLGLVVQATQEECARSIQHHRYLDLSQVLGEIADHFHADSAVFFDKHGKILVYDLSTEGYQSRLDDLGEKLVWTQVKKTYWLEVRRTPQGAVQRYLSPLYGSDGLLEGGISVEIPLATVEREVHLYILKVLGAALLIALFVSSIITPVLLLFMVKPLNTIRGELEALSKGDADLTFQIQVKTHDEIGEVAQWFNSFIGRIRAMVLRVLEHSQHLTQQVESLTQSTDEVSAMSGDVTTTVQQIARGAEDQAVKIAEVNQLMQEVQESMKDVEKKAHETSDAVYRATQTARVGGKLARGAIDKMAELSEAILKNSQMVGKLGAKSKEVGRVVEIISGIAEQTNLLSLNAAIEAARAGEQGRGFAVVAEEIRALADGSSRAVQEITQLVSEMQDETTGVVESMEKSAEGAQGGKDSIRQMEGALDEIVTVIEGVVSLSQNITEMIGAQSQRFTRIAHSIQDINAVSEESAASTEEVSASTEQASASMEQVSATCRELAAMSLELKSMVEKFKIR